MSRVDRIPQGDDDFTEWLEWLAECEPNPMPFVQRWSMGWTVDPIRDTAVFDDNPNIVRGEE